MDSAKRFQCCLVGGTFDRFHTGHKLLLSAACRDSSIVEVHVTTNDLAVQKSVFIEDYDTRVNKILDWASEHSYFKIKIFPLNNKFGPAATHTIADSIVATEETIPTCTQINELRTKNGLSALQIIEVPHIIDSYGIILSSSRIRSGTIDQDGNSWIESIQRDCILKMHSGLDKELKTPMGNIFPGPEELPEVAMSSALESLPSEKGAIIAVGDVTVRTLLEMEITPDIALIDGMTKRVALSEDSLVDTSQFERIIHANNPAGSLTPSLLQSVEQAISSQDSVVIIVEGEEDLAPLYIHCLAPIGSVVLYGQPKVGVVSQITTLSVKERCRELLSIFEVVK